MGCGVVLFKSPLLPTTTIRKVASYVIRAESMDHGKTTLEGSRPANVLYLHASLNLLGHRGLSNLLEIAVDNTKYMAELVKSYPQFELISKPVTNIFLYRYIPSWLRKDNDQFEVRYPISPSSKTIEVEEVSTLYSDSTQDQTLDLSDLTDKEEGSFVEEETSLYTNEENQVIDYFTTELQAKQKREGKGFVSKTTVKTTKYPNYTKGVAVLRVVIANPLVTRENIKAVVEEQIKLSEELEKEYKMKNHSI